MTQAITEQQQTLFDTIELPLRGRSWPKGIALVAWIIIILIGARLIYIATNYEQVPTPIVASVVLAYTGMVVVTFFMWVGHTTITKQGIKQDWILKRELAWEDLKFAKFVPLFYSKRLICFTKRGRPIVFQGASQDLQVAFAHISLAYQRAF